MSEPDPRSESERLRALEERIARMRGREPPPRMDEHYSQASLAWRMVIELVAGLVLGFGMGYGIDWALGTMPVFLVIFTFLGLAAGIRTMLRSADEVRRKAGAPAKREGGAAAPDRSEDGHG
ncbi:AtpZ/AtpI family protein [Rubellimicrobium sp. CFH 75288]|uniref:AtpZ/AtpI family protein n=1 Tax=Rubellimicrobium sp. CFH 75288 TaxID=2697034 RepID=UPI001411F35E|nr:AtpZ/AtpI family protein [Rubellimicrobium sp. CFH 75288]NAZ37570.1 F0F1 ATP synthase subunit I [Rubellimicrobium sp. CFH 75288]